METRIYESNSKNSCKFKTYSTNELSTKMFNYILSNKEIELLVNDFNKKYPYPFKDSVGFHLGRSMVKHCSPQQLMNWKIGIRDKGIMNDNDNDKTTIETRSIVNDFINSEYKKAQNRILVYKDIVGINGNIIKNAPVYDYSVVNIPEEFKSYKSILFNNFNLGLIKSYYCDYIYFFPVTIAEFEKSFFLFLTFLAEDEYPYGSHMHDSEKYIESINEIVRMRYIDINDRFILSFLYILSIDKELLKTGDAIYEEIKHNYDMTRDQVACMGS